jgi:hypothetical protein
MTKLWPRRAVFLVAVILMIDAPQFHVSFGDSVTGSADTAFHYGAQAGTAVDTGAQIVTCVLPGEIRSLGSTTYIAPGRTIRITRKDCEIRGGRSENSAEPGAEIPGDAPTEKDDVVSPDDSGKPQ